jgi:Spy/CpxP family protein refolding chaperone
LNKGDTMLQTSRLAWIGIVALSLWAATVYGQPHHGMGPMGRGDMMGDGPGMMLPLVLRAVDLTDVQEKQIHAIMQAHRGTFRTLFGELRAAQEDMTDKLFAAGDVRAEDLTSQVQRVAQLRAQLLQEGLKVALEVRAVLSPEQLAKAAEVKERMRSLRSEMRDLFREKR